ncbi:MULTISPECIES: hypothetical protein [unclassified Campylobacter]|uniref:hypothetical protein n=1 Tax=unclassified Campylobacter TaxID=2593542 RepID=UPI0022E9ADAF|nr:MULTISPECIES: hypothetical protein [unclassified Campylobacter]MDA3062840.1 hypothetical protein [Campylobacter sp. JMF_14 EL1]MDA3073734.1 hypothetical protein [Campylobacter sp. JMF_10 EL2]
MTHYDTRKPRAFRRSINHANPRKPTQTHANPRKPTQTHANPRKPTQTHANALKNIAKFRRSISPNQIQAQNKIKRKPNSSPKQNSAQCLKAQEYLTKFNNKF